MSKEELALALTKTAIKCGIFNIPSNVEDLPYDSNGHLEQNHIESCMSDIANIYHASLKVVSEIFYTESWYYIYFSATIHAK